MHDRALAAALYVPVRRLLALDEPDPDWPRHPDAHEHAACAWGAAGGHGLLRPGRALSAGCWLLPALLGGTGDAQYRRPAGVRRLRTAQRPVDTPLPRRARGGGRMRNGFTRTRYELRALGPSVLALPPLVVAIFLGVTLLAAYNDAHVSQSAALVHHDLAAGVLYLLEFGIPPVAGLAAAQLIAHDPAKELHLAVVRPYRRTMLLRLSLFGLWTLLVAAAVSIAASRTGYWLVTCQAPQDQLTWLAPVVWGIGLGALLALPLRSTVASRAILGMLWLGEPLPPDHFPHSS